MPETTPMYEKSRYAPQWEYRPMTWEHFLVVREWAQEVAIKEGYPVYLVGSTLWKTWPRDLDVSMLMPLSDFEARYGEIPEDEEKRKGYLAHGRFNVEKMPYAMTLQERLFWAVRVDFKVQPDVWFPTRDRLLLADPMTRVKVRDWRMYEPLEGEESQDA